MTYPVWLSWITSRNTFLFYGAITLNKFFCARETGRLFSRNERFQWVITLLRKFYFFKNYDLCNSVPNAYLILFLHIEFWNILCFQWAEDIPFHHSLDETRQFESSDWHLHHSEGYKVPSQTREKPHSLALLSGERKRTVKTYR